MITSLVLRSFYILAVFLGGIYLLFIGQVAAAFALHTLGLGPILYGALSPSTRLFGEIETQIPNGVSITIDDGPHPKDTPQILDLLDQYDAKATFFIIGENAKRHPDLVRDIAARGHQLGNHTEHHPERRFWVLGPLATYREIADCQETIRSITGTAPKTFRAPVGHFNWFVHPILKQLNLQLIGWSARGFDTNSKSIDQAEAAIRKDLKNGSIVLAHEGTDFAAELIERILKRAKDQNLSIKLLPEIRQS